MSQIVIKFPANQIDAFVERLQGSLNIEPLDSKSDYERFRGRIGKNTITVYTSGKVVYTEDPIVRGVIRSILEELTETSSFKIVIGSDEAGKGEWLGPLTVAAVALDRKGMAHLQAEGVMDSKEMSPSRITEIARGISPHSIASHVVTVTPQRFNELLQEVKDEGRGLNDMLAWAHAKAIAKVHDEVIARHTFGSVKVVIDEFDKLKTERRLSRVLDLAKIYIEQRPKAEDEIAVAAASILARAQWEKWVDQASKRLGLDLRHLSPKLAMNHGEASEFAKIKYIERGMQSRYIREWYFKYCKGKAASYVARAEEAPSKVIKTLENILDQGKISKDELARALSEVKAETVEPFANRADHSMRKKRLSELEDAFVRTDRPL